MTSCDLSSASEVRNNLREIIGEVGAEKEIGIDDGIAIVVNIAFIHMSKLGPSGKEISYVHQDFPSVQNPSLDTLTLLHERES